MWKSVEKEVPGMMDYVLVYDGEYRYDVARLVKTEHAYMWRSSVTGNTYSANLCPYWMPIPIFVQSDIDRKEVVK